MWAASATICIICVGLLTICMTFSTGGASLVGSLAVTPVVAALWFVAYFHNWSTSSLFAAQTSTVVWFAGVAAGIVFRRRRVGLSEAHAALAQELVGLSAGDCKALQFNGVSFRLPFVTPLSEIKGFSLRDVSNIETLDESLPHEVEYWPSFRKVTRRSRLWVFSRKRLPPFGLKRITVDLYTAPNKQDTESRLEQMLEGANALCRLGTAVDYGEIAVRYAEHYEVRENARKKSGEVQKRIRILQEGASAFDRVDQSAEKSRSIHPERVALDRDLALARSEDDDLKRRIATTEKALTELVARTRNHLAVVTDLQAAYTARDRAAGVFASPIQTGLAELNSMTEVNSFDPSPLLIVVSILSLIFVGIVDVVGHLQ